jgi:DNA-binding CsgD family transcriptional regulator
VASRLLPATTGPGPARTLPRGANTAKLDRAAVPNSGAPLAEKRRMRQQQRIHQLSPQRAAFAVVCGAPAIAQSLVAALEGQGFSHDAEAAIAILLDIPRGFALQEIAAPWARGRRLIVMTWSLCPEYWEDLWDFRPAILIVGDGLGGGDLAGAVSRAAQGEQYRLTPGTPATLTPAERRALRLLARGYPNQQIADQLAMHPQSVKNTLAAIYRKLGLKNRAEALLYYWGIWHVITRAPDRPADQYGRG